MAYIKVLSLIGQEELRRITKASERIVCFIDGIRNCDFGMQTSYSCKEVPLQAWSGPEGSRKLRFPDFMTTAQDGDKVVNLTPRPPLPPGNTPGIHFC
jgi:hypothetical protein